MKDWMIRAVKTFVQAFLGILIPGVLDLLNGGFVDFQTAWQTLNPFASAALAAGIAAVWNIVLEAWGRQNENT